MGAAIEQVPGIKKAKEMGYEVAVIDYNPQAVGIPLADKFYNVSTIDPEGVLNAARDFGANGFLTLATDLPMRAVAYASEKMGISGISQKTALLATDKGEMIKALKEYDVPTPWFHIVNNYEELISIGKNIEYPCIMKPTDNAASRGVALVRNYQDLINNYDYSKNNSHSGQIIIEEFMEGPEVSVEILCYKGVVNVLQVTDKITTGSPHFVEIGHNQPSQLDSKVISNIKEVATNAVKALGITEGPAHVEIIVTEEGAKIVELGARLGGDCITSHLVLLSTGIDMVKETIKVLCGDTPSLIPSVNNGSSIRFITGNEVGKFDHIFYNENVKLMEGFVEISEIMKSGDQIQSINSSDDRIGYVISCGKDVNESSLNAEKIMKEIKIVMRNEE